MFDYITSAGDTPQTEKQERQISRFWTMICLLDLFMFSLTLFDKTLRQPSPILAVASVVLVCLEIPVIAISVIRMSSNARLKEQCLARVPQTPWIARLTPYLGAALAISLVPFLVGVPGKTWERWSHIALPFIFLSMMVSDFNCEYAVAEAEGTTEIRRRWANVYRLGWRAGSFFSIPARNIPSI
jgi:hypothetical protein